MADGTTLDPGTGGDKIATDDLGATGKVQWVKLMDGTDGGTTVIPGDATNGLDVDVTRVQGTVAVSGPLTDTQLRATAVPVSGTVTASGPLTDAQLRATAVPVSGTVTANLGTAAVTNAGTFAVQIAANSSVNQAQIAGTATSVNSGVKDAGTQRVILASDQTVVPISDNAGSLTVDNAGTFAVQIAANSSVNQAQIAGTATDTNSGVKSAGTQRVVLATDQPQLTNALKVDASATTQPVSGTVTANPAAATTGGATPNTYVSAATTNATSVKASAGTLYGIIVSNVNAAARYLKVFNKASAPTVGTDTPVMNIIIPGNTAGAGNTIPLDGVGVAFGTGIAFAITTGVALLDSGAVAASEITVTLLTK